MVLDSLSNVQQANTGLLHPHPYNQRIYGNEDVTELAERIKASNWIKPLVITQVNRIISGHRRWQAALLLGYISVPVERRTFASETEELEALLLENASREKTVEQKVREGQMWREIEADKAAQRQKAFLKQGEVSPVPPNLAEWDKGETREKVAGRVGMAKTNYTKAAKVVETADRLKEAGKVQESQALLNVLNKQSVDAAAKVLKMPEPEQVAVLETIATSKAKDVKEAKSIVKREELAELAKTVVLPDTTQILPGHFLNVGEQIADNSVDFVFTDPPYHEEHLALWTDLGLFASRVLKPGGMLLAYSGQTFLPQVLNALSEHLEYCWLIGQFHKGQHIQIWKHSLWNQWKPLVLFSKGKPVAHEWFIDAYDGVKGDKEAHEWAQGEDEAQYFIQKLTRPGELVLDPMCGSGSIVRMAHRFNRRSIGIEIDEYRYNVALGTMKEVVA